MPSSPKIFLWNLLCKDKFKVFIIMETDHKSHTDRHIGISRKSPDKSAAHRKADRSRCLRQESLPDLFETSGSKVSATEAHPLARIAFFCQSGSKSFWFPRHISSSVTLRFSISSATSWYRTIGPAIHWWKEWCVQQKVGKLFPAV